MHLPVEPARMRDIAWPDLRLTRSHRTALLVSSMRRVVQMIARVDRLHIKEKTPSLGLVTPAAAVAAPGVNRRQGHDARSIRHDGRIPPRLEEARNRDHRSEQMGWLELSRKTRLLYNIEQLTANQIMALRITTPRESSESHLESVDIAHPMHW